MRCKVQVTQEDIDKGCKTDAGACPIARALHKADIPGMVSAAVGPLVGYVHLEDKSSYFFRLPIEASVFIRQFDSGDVVVPFSFELELEKSVKKS